MLFWLLGSGGGLKVTARQTVLVKSRARSASIDIGVGLCRYQPLEYAKAGNDFLYFTNGIDGVFKWDGTISNLRSVGVAAPTTAVTIASSGTGSITGTYQAYVRFVDEFGNFSNLSPASNLITASSAGEIKYTNVPAPTEEHVVRRQILRNTAGQLLVFFVEVDTTDTTKTEFTGTMDDDTLRDQSWQALFDETLSESLATRRGVPPTDKHTVAFYNSRLWLYGEETYTRGSITCTSGSTTITGVGTEWPAAMKGRFLYIRGSDRSYEIDSVDTVNQTLTLLTPYVLQTQKFANYAIRNPPATRHLLYFSEAGEYDAWPAIQALEVGSSEDLDEYGTGLLASQSYLFILQRRHIYRLTFLDDPSDDGGMFLAARRGCINNRCWATADGHMYMLDERGVFRFDGSSVTEDLSTPIQDLFFFDNPDHPYRINWKASRYFHCLQDRDRTTIRWFVALTGQYLPQHAICVNYQTQSWWVESYPFPVGDSTTVKQVNTLPAVAGNSTLYAMNLGTLDVAVSSQGDTFAAVSGATRSTVTVTGAILPAQNVVGSPITIVSGKGKGQTRLVASVSGLVLRTTRIWLEQPDETSVLQIGGIPWRWRSGWYRWPDNEENAPRRIAARFRPKTDDSTFDVRAFNEYATAPELWSLSWPRIPGDSSGIVTTDGSTDAVMSMDQPNGIAYVTLDGYRRYDEWQSGTLAVELRGVSSGQPTRLYEITIDGAEPQE